MIRATKRTLRVAVLSALMILILTACGGGAQTAAPAAEADNSPEEVTAVDTNTPTQETSTADEEVPPRDEGVWYAGGLAAKESGVDMKIAFFRIDGEPVVIVINGEEILYGDYETEDAKFDDGVEYTLLKIWDSKFGYYFNDDGSGFIVDSDANKFDAAPLDEADAMELMDATSMNEEGEGGYSFVEEQSNVSDFKDYDDIIAHLEPGQGYAYIKLTGADNDVLAVTKTVFEADNSSCEADLYLLNEGTPVYLGIVSGNGSAYPLRAADGILYGGDNHSYETYFISSEYHSLMAKDSVYDGANDGSNEFIGFLRETNDYDHDKDFTGGTKEFEELLANRETIPIVKFTLIP